ncbi:MAG TPA: hypothetical protein VGN83_26190 [Falsiroseomonas sp.]|jgi:hypothetical protein|nr:hypothetical protein [Falsiroseomonas sp.]
MTSASPPVRGRQVATFAYIRILARSVMEYNLKMYFLTKTNNVDPTRRGKAASPALWLPLVHRPGPGVTKGA